VHRLLQRQVARHLGPVEALPPEWERFLAAVDAAYVSFEDDRALLERSMEISSRELYDRNLALAAAEQKFRAIFENASDGLFQADLDWRLTAANPALAEVFGFPSADALLAEAGGRFFQRAFAGGGLPSEPGCDSVGEVEAVRVDGGAVWVALTIRSLRVGDQLRWEGAIRDVTRRRRRDAERDELQRKLMIASRHAGMAEVASGVLHNVGNVLNSINVAASMIVQRVGQSRLPGVLKVAGLLQGHPREDLGRFLSEDARGKQVPEFLQRLGEHLQSEQQELLTEMEAVTRHLDHVKRIVAMQQEHAKVGGLAEEVDIHTLLDDAVALSITAFERHGVRLIRDVAPLPRLRVDPHRVVQILVNLLANGRQAMSTMPVSDRRLVLRAGPIDAERFFLEVEDAGVGIPAENLTRIFSHGFTTKASGHGFGLHSSANAASAMRGSLVARSPGAGLGSCFRLELPMRADAEAAAAA
jgi:signal transduction histidine kinase